MHLKRALVVSSVSVLALALGAVTVGASPFATTSAPARIDIITREVGEALGRCTLIDPASARLGCNIRTSLRDGTLTSDGTLINVPGEISTGAITGGTGKYRNARGESTLDLGPPEGPHRATFHVILLP